MKKIFLLFFAAACFSALRSDAQDLCTSNPRYCKLLSDTAGAKMMLITLPPGAKLTQHTHPVNQGYVIRGGLYRWTFDDKKIESFEMKAGGEFHGGPETAHHSWNAGKTTIQFVLVEKKD